MSTQQQQQEARDRLSQLAILIDPNNEHEPYALPSLDLVLI